MPRRRTLGLLALALGGILLSAPVTLAAMRYNLLVQAQQATAGGNPQTEIAAYTALLQSLGNDPRYAEEAGTYWQKLGRLEQTLGHDATAYTDYQKEVAAFDQAGMPQLAKDDRRMAEALQPVLRLFAQSPAPPSAAAGSFPYVPAYGAYIGGAFDRDPRIGYHFGRIPAIFGRSQAVYEDAVPWGTSLHAGIAQGALRNGGALQVEWLPPTDLSQVQDNAYTRGFLQSLAALKVPVFLRFAPEFQFLSVWPNNASLYVEKFRLIATLAHSLSPNVAMVWAPNVMPQTGISAYYPGNAYVDWVGVDLYSDYAFQGKATASAHLNAYYREGILTNPLKQLAYIYSRYAGKKPIMIAEWAPDLVTGTGQSNEPWAQNVARFAYSYLPMLYPDVKAIFLFDGAPAPSPNLNYNLWTDPALDQTIAHGLQNPWYLSRVGQSATVTWHEVTTAFPTGPATVAAYVNLPGEPYVARVEYNLNGTLIGESSRPPFLLQADLPRSSVPETLTVIAVGQNGKTLTRQWTIPALPIAVTLNGTPVSFPVDPVIRDGRVLVPLRNIAQALGGQVTWLPQAREIGISRANHRVELWVGQGEARIDGTPVPLDAPPAIENGTTLVPVRFLAQAFGLSAGWDAGTRTVVLSG